MKYFLISFCVSLCFIINSIDCRRHHMSFYKSSKLDYYKLKPINDIYKDCGSETGTIVSVNVKDCTKAPCIFHKGSNYTLDLAFNSKVNTKSISNHVYGVIAHVPIPFHLPNDDGCALGINCPVKNGDSLHESVTLPILDEYPKISLFVKWQVLDDIGKQMVCFLFPVQIQ